jgi:hypothetical protein
MFDAIAFRSLIVRVYGLPPSLGQLLVQIFGLIASPAWLFVHSWSWKEQTCFHIQCLMGKSFAKVRYLQPHH